MNSVVICLISVRARRQLEGNAHLLFPVGWAAIIVVGWSASSVALAEAWSQECQLFAWLRDQMATGNRPGDKQVL